MDKQSAQTHTAQTSSDVMVYMWHTGLLRSAVLFLSSIRLFRQLVRKGVCGDLGIHPGFSFGPSLQTKMGYKRGGF